MPIYSINGNKITVSIIDTNRQDLVAVFNTSSKASVKVNGVEQIRGQTSNNFIYHVKCVVISEDGTEREYNVTVEQASSGYSGGGGGSASSSEKSASYIAVNTLTPYTGSDESDKEDRFTDLNNVLWAEEYIYLLKDKGIISEVSNTSFEPERYIKCKDLVKMAVHALNTDALSGDTGFSDVNTNERYNDYIYAAMQKGIVNVKGDNKFGVGALITREDMASILYRAFVTGSSTDKTDAEILSDEDDIADYALDAVKYFAASGIINGIGNGIFSTKAYATRAQAAKIIGMLIK